MKQCDQSAVVSFHLRKPHDYEVLWLPYLCRLVLKEQRCALEEHWKKLEEHPDKRKFSILYFYGVTNGLLS